MTIKSVASYKDERVIKDLNKFNFFYGLNGTGKTTITRLLKQYPDLHDTKYSNCTIEGINRGDGKKIYVYNQDYIEGNFYQKNTQDGIFTLGEDNATAQQAIDEAQNKIVELKTKKEEIKGEINKIKKSMEEGHKRIVEKIWEKMVDLKKNTNEIFKNEILTGYLNDKKAFANKIIDKNPSEKSDNIDEKINELIKEFEEIVNDEATEKTLFERIDVDFSDIENAPIWHEPIIGDKESYLADIIEKLDHVDWVYQGVKSYIDHTDDCPFCKQEMSFDLKEKIKAHFDKSYQEKLDDLKNIKTEFDRKHEDLFSVIDRNIDNGFNKNNFIGWENTLNLQANSNNNIIGEKIKNPSKKVELTQIGDVIEELNAIIEEENEKITKYNENLKDQEKYINEFESKFWSLLRAKYDTVIEIYISQKKNNADDIEIKQDKIDKTQAVLAEQENIIQVKQQETKNIDKTIAKINENLTFFGLDGFKIVKVEQPLEQETAPQYRLQFDEDDQGDEIFKKLSEGEKTIISFLYFIEQTKGVDEDCPNENNRIIVIDDPISSLSFNAVFEVAHFVVENYLVNDTPFCQIFLLTHHLYFIHEIRKQNSIPHTQHSFYRVSKDHQSNINKGKIDDIKNYYEEYWQTLTELKSNNPSSVLIPNVMRNILEHYFSFIRPDDKLSDAINNILPNEPMAKVFIRYINRESHYDHINLADSKEIANAKFFEYFKTIFAKTNQIQHFKNMKGW